MSDFRSYSGEEFYSLVFPDRPFLVDGILKEKDSLLLVGSPKSGKSILIFQLICSLTSQHPFLDKYAVPRPCTVSYVQLEGKLANYHDRLIRMTHSLELNPSFMHYKYSGPINLLDKKQANRLCEEIKQFQPTLDVLIFDPLYFMFPGSLSDDAVVREVLGNLRIIQDFFGCAMIIVHHTHKPRLDTSGALIDEGDSASFGSIFLHAWPDHVMLLNFNKKTGLRTFTCDTQRSGDILTSLNLRLIQPDPLYFEPTEGQSTAMKQTEILDFLRKNGPSTYREILTGMSLSESTFFYSIKPLIVSKVVKKDSSFKPQKYTL